MTVAEQPQAALAETPETEESTRLALLEAALLESGKVARQQIDIIQRLHEALQRRTNEVGAWQQRFWSANNRLAENWPPNPEIKRHQEWVKELSEMLARTQAELAAVTADRDGWKAKYEASYVATPTVSGPPTAPVDLDGLADDEMLG